MLTISDTLTIMRAASLELGFNKKTLKTAAKLLKQFEGSSNSAYVLPKHKAGACLYLASLMEGQSRFQNEVALALNTSEPSIRSALAKLRKTIEVQ